MERKQHCHGAELREFTKGTKDRALGYTSRSLNGMVASLSLADDRRVQPPVNVPCRLSIVFLSFDDDRDEYWEIIEHRPSSQPATRHCHLSCTSKAARFTQHNGWRLDTVCATTLLALCRDRGCRCGRAGPNPSWQEPLAAWSVPAANPPYRSTFGAAAESLSHPSIRWSGATS